MGTEIARLISPEEELAAKQEELAVLQAELVDRELFLTNLRIELSVFEARYLREVGVLYAELDDWNAKIAELFADETGTDEARVAATEARNNAEESYSAAHGEAANVKEVIPSPELKSLYREVARRIHPDLSTNEADRAKREQLMSAANRAYQQGDLDALRRILEEYESSPESVQGTGVAAELLRVILQIKQISRRLAQIEAEIIDLTSTDIAKLMAKVQTSIGQGRDLLAEMTARLRATVSEKRSQFEASSSKTGPR